MADEEYKVEKAICCSVKTFTYTNYIWSVLSVGLLILGVVGVVVESGVLVVLPPTAYFIAIGIGAYGVVVIVIGVVGQKQTIELCFLFYIFFVSLGLILQASAYCYLLLYANDVVTVTSLDNAAINAQKTFEENLFRYAQEEPEKWQITQNKLECCGIDFEAGLGKSEEDLNSLESGTSCSNVEQKAEMDDLRLQAESENFDGDIFEPARDSLIIGVKTGFFCKDKISLFMVENTVYIAVILCLILLVQITALVSAARMYWVPDYLDGWMFDESEVEEVATRKGIALPKKPENTGTGFVGNARAISSRLSFRIKNALTADPGISETEGFMKRLSMRRNPNIVSDQTFNAPPAKNPVVGFGEPNPTYAPQSPSSPPPGMFKRISNRLSNRMNTPFAGGFFSMPKEPAGPPPGFTPVGSPSSPLPPGMPRQPVGPPPNTFAPTGPAYGAAAQRAPQISDKKANRKSDRLQLGLQKLYENDFLKPRNVELNTGQGSSKGAGGYASSNPMARPGMGSMSNPVPPPSFGQPPSRVSNAVGGGNFGLPPPNAGFSSNFSSNVNTVMASNMKNPMDQSAPPPNSFRQNSNRELTPLAGIRSAKSNNQIKQTGGSRAASQAQKKSSMAVPSTLYGHDNNGKKKASAAAIKPKQSTAGGGGAPAGGLLAQIQMGTKLKKAVTNDRSAPMV